MIKRERLGILFIGIYLMISALAILITFNVQQIPTFNVRFGVPFLPELVVKFIIGIGSIIISYGYLRFLKWGFWSMIMQSGYFFLVCIIQLMTISNWKPSMWIILYHGIVIVYTLFHYKEFGLYSKHRIIDN